MATRSRKFPLHACPSRPPDVQTFSHPFFLSTAICCQLRTTDFLMMRKAQDRAGLHDGLEQLEGIKGLAGFGSTLASNKFVRAALREEVRRSLEIVGIGLVDYAAHLLVCRVPCVLVARGRLCLKTTESNCIGLAMIYTIVGVYRSTQRKDCLPWNPTVAGSLFLRVGSRRIQFGVTFWSGRTQVSREKETLCRILPTTLPSFLCRGCRMTHL